MSLVGLSILNVFPHPEGVILISVVKFAIWQHEKISVFAATKAQVVTLGYAEIKTLKGAPILFMLHVLETETVGFPVDYAD